MATMGKGIWRVLFWNSLDAEEAIAALGNTRSEIAVPCLRRLSSGNMKLAGYVPEYIRRDAVTALGKIPSLEAEYSLIEAALRDDSGTVTYYATRILQEDLSSEAALKLVQILGNDEEASPVREQATLIIRGTYPQITMKPLLQMALNGESHSLRSRAAAALRFYDAEHDMEKVVDFLLNNLRENPDPEIRQLQNAIEISFGGQFDHCHAAGAVRMKGDHFVAQIFQRFPGILGRWGDKSKKG